MRPPLPAAIEALVGELAGEQVLAAVKKRDAQWTTELALVLGPDSGRKAPLCPEAVREYLEPHVVPASVPTTTSTLRAGDAVEVLLSPPGGWTPAKFVRWNTDRPGQVTVTIPSFDPAHGDEGVFSCTRVRMVESTAPRTVAVNTPMLAADVAFLAAVVHRQLERSNNRVGHESDARAVALIRDRWSK